MNFTYEAYSNLLDILKNKGYTIIDYLDNNNYSKSVILRHDVDNTLDKALEIAQIEYEKDVKSTYFLLVSTDFYNIFSKKSHQIISKIQYLGHNIGLHFDEKRYNITSVEELNEFVNYESSILSNVTNNKIEVVSMHRPSEWILNNDIHFNNLINTYSKKYFKNFKYISDSRMTWRENVEDIILSGVYDHLHILTHPFWYNYSQESAKDKIINFIESAKKERLASLTDNIRDLDKLLNER